MTDWSATEIALVTEMQRTARGPKREGLFALWLTVRVAEDLLHGREGADRSHKRRVALLQARLSSLVLPLPLKRALQGALAQLAEATPAAAAQVLAQLAAPARETVGTEAAEAISRAGKGGGKQ